MCWAQRQCRIGKEKALSRVGQRLDGRMNPVISDYALTAPAVRPSMKLFIRQRNRMIRGSAVTT